MKTLFACCLVLASTPALAQDRAHNPQQISDALKAGCTVQQTHQMSGKLHPAPAIVRCPTKPTGHTVNTPKPSR